MSRHRRDDTFTQRVVEVLTFLAVMTAILLLGTAALMMIFMMIFGEVLIP